MFRVCVRPLVLAVMILLSAIIPSAVGAASPAYRYRMRGATTYASLHGEVDCLSQSVAITAADELSRYDVGRPEARRGVLVQFFETDYCGEQDYTKWAIGYADVSKDEFALKGNLATATIRKTVDVGGVKSVVVPGDWPVESYFEDTISINLTMTATTPIETSSSVSVDREPEYFSVFQFSGNYRMTALAGRVESNLITIPLAGDGYNVWTVSGSVYKENT